MRWNVPNILTLSRLFAAPALALAFAVFARPTADWVALALFVGASASDWMDGHLARRWSQTSRFGAMLDPIADKAMIIIAISLVIGTSGLHPWVLIPAAVILFREVFVSGLREFLGADAGRLAVTRLAKWKTTAQMVAVSLLMLSLALEEQAFWIGAAMTDEMIAEATVKGPADPTGLWHLAVGSAGSFALGVAALWLAAALTGISGWDYFRKSLPFLREKPA